MLHCSPFKLFSTNLILFGSSWYILFHFGHLETMFCLNTKENGFTDELLFQCDSVWEEKCIQVANQI